MEIVPTGACSELDPPAVSSEDCPQDLLKDDKCYLSQGRMQTLCRSSARKLEIDFPFTKKVNYRALGTCLLFTTSNKEPTFDLDSSLAHILSFLLFQFCS